MRKLALIAVLLVMPFAATAQDNQQKLADIRAEIIGLMGSVNGLKAQLQVNNPEVTGVQNPGPALEQIAALEGELRRLTGQVENLELYLGRVVNDGTREINDLRLRLTEIEGGDLLEWEEVPPLGGDTTTSPVIISPIVPPIEDAPLVASTEQLAFNTAKSALEQGNAIEAERLFDEFLLNYPGGKLSSNAGFRRGEALAVQSKWDMAARAFLDNFSGSPDGEMAANSLFMLGLSLGKLGQTDAACQTLNEVPRRYPDLAPDLASKVEAEANGLACS